VGGATAAEQERTAHQWRVFLKKNPGLGGHRASERKLAQGFGPKRTQTERSKAPGGSWRENVSKQSREGGHVRKAKNALSEVGSQPIFGTE